MREFGISENKIRPEAINEFFSGRSIWGNSTIFFDIKDLNPSSFLSFSNKNGVSLNKYTPEIEYHNESDNIEDAGIDLDNLMHQEVEQMIFADVPACVVVSGGLDSSYLTAIASKFCPSINSFNVAYEGNWPFDERKYAENVAKKYGTIHHQVEIKNNEYTSILEKTILHMSQPNSAPHCISTYALFSAVNSSGFKFALTGEGADEFFGGYKRFQTANFNDNKKWLPDYLEKLSCINSSLRWDLYSHDYKELLSSIDEHQLFCKEQIDVLSKNNNKLDTLLKFDQEYRFPYYILRRVDQLSMANSIEVRVPFCQLRVRNFAHKLQEELKLDQYNVKKVLYESAKNKLDDDILRRKKQPFTLPITAMLKLGHPLMDIAQETLFSNSLKKRNIYNDTQLQILFERQISSPSDESSWAIWSIMILELWMRKNNINFEVEK